MGTYDVCLTTIDGLTLVGDVAIPDGAARAAVSLAHPHPLYGGDRANAVVDALFRALPAVGFAALRFDFRGVGASEGAHDKGRAERLDVAAAVDLLDTLVPGVPIVAAGYSFGALVTLDVTDERIVGWFAVAAPIGRDHPRALAADDHRPKQLLVPEHDQYCPPSTAMAAVADWSATTIASVPMADHFLSGALDVVTDEAVAFVSALAAR
jgi:uncharacterized protein